jgi:DNA primase
MGNELNNLLHILESFLGESKNGISSSTQCQFNCPRCAEDKGVESDGKHNLEINLAKQRYNCWACGPVYEDMHGSIIKLIKIFGNEKILEDYKKEIYSLRESKLYELTYNKDDFNIDSINFKEIELELPSSYRLFKRNKHNPHKALEYLFNRGIGWDIIEEFRLGYTLFDVKNKNSSTRIIIPSYDEFGELNYWTGRDYSGLKWKQKYFNPDVERKDIVFNEDKIQWDCDITLVEGPFDHIVVPNSIPLLGKALKTDFMLYSKLMNKANANVNIFLDGDAFDTTVNIYKTLNHGKLYNRVRYIPIDKDLDPSKLFELGGNKAILEHISNAKKISEIYLYS